MECINGSIQLFESQYSVKQQKMFCHARHYFKMHGQVKENF